MTPALRICAATVGSSWTLRAIKRNPGKRPINCRATLVPSCTGIERSTTTRSGSSRSIVSSNDPSSATITTAANRDSSRLRTPCNMGR